MRQRDAAARFATVQNSSWFDHMTKITPPDQAIQLTPSGSGLTFSRDQCIARSNSASLPEGVADLVSR